MKSESINKLVNNKRRIGPYTLRVLGSTKGMRDMSRFYKKNSDLLEIVAMQAFTELTQGKFETINDDAEISEIPVPSFTKEQFEFFRLGVGFLPTFMRRCAIEEGVQDHNRSLKTRQEKINDLLQ